MDYMVTEVKDLLCFKWQCGSGYEMKKRGAHGIVLCDGSEFSFFNDGKEIIADRNHLLFLPQNSSYSFKCRRAGITYTYNFCGALPFSEPYSLYIADNSRCVSYAEEMAKNVGEYTKIGLMYRIFGEVLDKESRINIPDIIRPQIDFIHESFSSTEITNAFLASLTNISEIYFRKLFVKNMGISPHEYITQLRIEKAKQLLTCGKNVSQVAAECGFSNLYYFSAAFKRKVGVSPSGYAEFYGKI